MRNMIIAAIMVFLICGCAQQPSGLTYSEAAAIAGSSAACNSAGSMTGAYTHDNATGAWQFTLSSSRADCSPVCIVYDSNQSTAVDMRCTVSPPPPSSTKPPVVGVYQNSQLGQVLVDESNMTLYVFKNDAPGKSNCNGNCASLWPPLVYSAGDNLSGVSGTLAYITRSDGTSQVTFNGMPLYRYSLDTAPGEALGNGYNNLWLAAMPNMTSFPAQPPSPPPTTDGSALVPAVKTGYASSVGNVLTDPDGKTLYVFLQDAADMPTCTGACAQIWPPLVLLSSYTLNASGIQGTLGTAGQNQVTYNGLPLYRYSGDSGAGTANGNGFNNMWYVATPGMTTFPSPPASTPPPSGGYGGGGYYGY